jgi:hypothetical protein
MNKKDFCWLLDNCQNIKSIEFDDRERATPGSTGGMIQLHADKCPKSLPSGEFIGDYTSFINPDEPWTNAQPDDPKGVHRRVNLERIGTRHWQGQQAHVDRTKQIEERVEKYKKWYKEWQSKGQTAGT